MVEMSMILSIEKMRASGGEYIIHFDVKIQEEDLADYVRRVLNDKGLSHREVAEAAVRNGMTLDPSTISRIISRASDNPTVSTLQALACGLDVEEDEIFAIARGAEIDEEKLRKSAQAALFFEIDALPEAERQARIDPLVDALRDAVKKLKKEKKL